MSIYRPKRKDGSFRSDLYIYDFWLTPPGATEPERFQGPTGQKTRAAAQKYETKQRELAALGLLSTRMTVEQAAKRYLDEVAVDAASDAAYKLQEFCMEELKRYYGPQTLLCAISPDDVAKAAAARARTPLIKYKRLGAFVRKRGREPGYAPAYAWHETDKLPRPSTVNRQVIEPMRRLLRRAKKQWKVPLDLEQFQWGGRDGIKRNEPAGRTREMTKSEERAFWHRLASDYHDLCELYIISGKRQSVWLGLTKKAVNLHERQITCRLLKKKQIEIVTMDLTEREYEIVYQAYFASPDDCDHVFTAPSGRRQEHGRRRRITPSMLRSKVAEACAAAKIEDFRPHDFRHTFGSRLMRETKDLKLTQQAMDHSSITSTLRYIHVLQADVTKARAKVTVSKGAGNNVRGRIKSGAG